MEEALAVIRPEAPAPFAYLFGKVLFALIQPGGEYQNSGPDRRSAREMKFNQSRPLGPRA